MAAGWFPNFMCGPDLHDGDDEGAGNGVIPPCISLSLPNCASWINGFDALQGGEPAKYGGDEAIGITALSES